MDLYSHKELASAYISSISEDLQILAQERTESVKPLMKKVLDAFAAEKLCAQHFSSLNGFAYGDEGRDVVDRVFARVLGAEKAAVRVQFVSGTHAIAAALFGVLRPGDQLLSVTGKPYETLEEVIGLRNKETNQGSLLDFGISYQEISLFEKEKINLSILKKALEIPRKVIFIQRSCGYEWRQSLSIDFIKQICDMVHFIQPEAICFLDNCYGEFVESKEPTEVGADLIAGSLLKNLGGTIAPAGGYIAGRSDLVEKGCTRLTSPGIGSRGGTTFNLNRLILQGLFLAPQMVSEALIGADLIAATFSKLGFQVNPLPGALRTDLIQAVRLNNEKSLKIVCKFFQYSSPVGSYLEPIPAPMPGYENDLIMAGGTFVDGSTSEFSADAPVKPPYNIYVQGGTHRTHIKIALEKALFALSKEQLVDLSKPS